MDLGIHNVQGIDVWAPRGPKPFGKASTLSREYLTLSLIGRGGQFHTCMNVFKIFHSEFFITLVAKWLQRKIILFGYFDKKCYVGKSHLEKLVNYHVFVKALRLNSL